MKWQYLVCLVNISSWCLLVENFSLKIISTFQNKMKYSYIYNILKYFPLPQSGNQIKNSWLWPCFDNISKKII